MAVSLGHGRCFSFFRFLLLLLKTRIMNNMPLSQPGPALMAPNMSAASRGMGSGEGRPLTLDIYVCALKAALKEEEEGEKKKKKRNKSPSRLKHRAASGQGSPRWVRRPRGDANPALVVLWLWIFCFLGGFVRRGRCSRRSSPPAAVWGAGGCGGVLSTSSGMSPEREMWMGRKCD